MDLAKKSNKLRGLVMHRLMVNNSMKCTNEEEMGRKERWMQLIKKYKEENPT